MLWIPTQGIRPLVPRTSTLLASQHATPADKHTMPRKVLGVNLFEWQMFNRNNIVMLRMYDKRAPAKVLYNVTLGLHEAPALLLRGVPLGSQCRY